VDFALGLAPVVGLASFRPPGLLPNLVGPFPDLLIFVFGHPCSFSKLLRI
jgi:hypothetical protein